MIIRNPCNKVGLGVVIDFIKSYLFLYAKALGLGSLLLFTKYVDMQSSIIVHVLVFIEQNLFLDYLNLLPKFLQNIQS